MYIIIYLIHYFDSIVIKVSYIGVELIMSENVINISDNDFNNIITNNKLVVVDFFATWCGPCRALSPYIDELATNHHHILFAKANIEETPVIANELDVKSLPCVIIFENGKEINRVVGFNKPKLQAIIENLSE